VFTFGFYFSAQWIVLSPSKKREEKADECDLYPKNGHRVNPDIGVILSCIQNKIEKISERRRSSTTSTVRSCAAQSMKILV
jgi:hypothetical protein